MDKTIILSELSRTIAELTECTAADAETFVRELFILAAERLEADGEVHIPAVGSFKLTDSAIAFAPDSELAAGINAPFAAFEAVELPADMNFDDDNDSDDNSPEASVLPINESPELIPTANEPEPDAEPEAEPEALPAEAPNPEPEPESEPFEEPETEPQQETAYTNNKKPRRNVNAIFILLACVICFMGGWCLGRYQKTAEKPNAEIATEPIADSESTESVESTETLASSEEISEVLPPEPEPAIVITDTIASGRFLTTMAREHYGQMDYWVYIYEENAANLGHPDRLSAGTVVVIPPAEKYGLVAGDAVKISEASRLALEIYGRFN